MKNLRSWLTYISILLFSWCYSLVFNGADWDLWARLAVGKTFFETGGVLKHDYLSYTPTKDIWVDHEWGSGVIFYFLSDRFGDAGLMLFEVFCVFIIVFLISKIIKMYNKEPNDHLNPVFYFLAYLAMFVNLSQVVRCQFFTFVFFTLWLYVLERVRRGENRLLWIFPVTMLVWANVHGGFVAGIGLLGMYGVGEFLNRKPWQKYFLIIVPSLLVTLINPYGFVYWQYLLEALSLPRIHISEWMNSITYWHWKKFFWYKFFLGLGVVSVIYDFISRKLYDIKNIDLKKIDFTKYIVVFACMYLSIKHVKHQTFYGIAAASFLYHDFYALVGFIKSLFGEKAQKFLNQVSVVKDGLVYFLVISLGLFFVINKPLEIRVDSGRYPVDSVEFIKENKIEGNLFSLFHWGSYIAWKLYPQNLIAIDGRYEEVYYNDLFLLSREVLKNEENWYDFLKKYHTDVIIMPHTAHAAHNSLTVDKKWEQVFFGQGSTVFVRKEFAKPIDAYVYPSKSGKYYNKTKYETDITFLNK